MLAAEKQHFTWFKFPLRVNTAKGEMCHLSWADKGSKQNLQRGHHHPLFWPWTGMCFRKTCKTCSVFCSLENNNERTLEGHTWEECTNSFQWSSWNGSSFFCDDGVQVYIGHFFLCFDCPPALQSAEYCHCFQKRDYDVSKQPPLIKDYQINLIFTMTVDRIGQALRCMPLRSPWVPWAPVYAGQCGPKMPFYIYIFFQGCHFNYVMSSPKIKFR